MIFKSKEVKVHPEPLLFSLLVLIESFFMFFLIYDKRIVGGHDAFYSFPLEYYFFNNFAFSGEIPQWIPFLTHGTTAAWFQAITGIAGLFPMALFQIGKILPLKNINFLTIFYLGIFWERLLLLTGTWLLGKKFFESAYTRFFVTVSVMGSCIWMTQLYFNFYFYYAVPLILYFFHEFLESGKWRNLFLAINLFVLQTIGNMIYFVPVVTLVIFLYWLLFSIFNFKEVKLRITHLKLDKNFITFLAGTGVILTAWAAFIHFGKDNHQMVIFRTESAGSDIGVPLNVFLTYGGNTGWIKWRELFLGVSPMFDCTLFIGFLPLPFILIGLFFNLHRRNIHILLLSLILLFFSLGTIVSVFFYYAWPFMKYYRHLALISPFVRVLLCFWAGFGLETIINRGNDLTARRPFRYLCILVASGFFVLSRFLGYLASHYKQSVDFLSQLCLVQGKLLVVTLKVFKESFLNLQFDQASTDTLCLAAFFLIFPFINLRKYYHHVLSFVLIFHFINVYSYYNQQIKMRTNRLEPGEYNMLSFERISYSWRRSESFNCGNPREAFMNADFIEGVLYWTVYPFLFKDQLGTSFQTVNWQRPFDNFMRAFWGQPINDSSKPLKGYVNSQIVFPEDRLALYKLAGVTEDKVQLFSSAYFFNTDEEISKLMSDPRYKGDILFVSNPKFSKKTTDPVPFLSWSTDDSLEKNSRLSFPYTVERFDANHFELEVNNVTSKPIWLLYSDVWHPGWQATVNGKPVKVFEANLAYKAVCLPAGHNRLNFFFYLRDLSLLNFFFSMNALFWVGMIVYLMGKIFLRREVIAVQRNH